MTKIKKIMAGCVTALSIASSMGISAYAEDVKLSHEWEALGRNIYGAPSSVTSEPDVFSIRQGKSGAIAKMKGIVHTTSGASSITSIHCETFYMNTITIKNYSTESYEVEPDVGSLNDRIPIKYSISVSTDTLGDTVVSTGHIEAV